MLVLFIFEYFIDLLIGPVCPSLVQLENGRIVGRSYEVGATLTFHCSDGYSLSGSAERTCLGQRRWSGQLTVCDNGGKQQWRIRGGGRGNHPPPLVAENFVCSNSNFSPTGAITPDHPPPLWPSPPPPFRKSCIRA